MSEACRLWIVVGSEREEDLARAGEFLAGLTLAAILHDGASAREALAERARSATRLEARCDARLIGARPGDAVGALAALDDCAEAHAGAQVAVLADEALARLALCRALELAPEAGERFELARAAVLAIDWPVPGALAAQHALSGLALDWEPPWNPNPPRRFPGGPGSAATGRA